MKLAILTGSVSRLAGGIFLSIQYPAKILAESTQITIKIFGLKDRYSDEDMKEWHPLIPQVSSVIGPKSFGYSPDFKKSVFLFSPDIMHIQGIWMYYSFVSLMLNKKNNIPYVVSPHGMLDSWAVKNSQWKKKIIGFLYEYEHLRRASCIHALCESEAKSIRQFGLKKPICLIPNGIDLPEQLGEIPEWRKQIGQDKKVLLFLGRIHPKKGLAQLLGGWSLLNRRDRQLADQWTLVIAGWDQLNHETKLKSLTRELQIHNNVRFIGPQFDKNKLAAYQFSSAFILPSFSEGLPMTVLEAWANKLPVLMTPECNIPEGFQSGAAIQISTHPENICKGLHHLLSLSDDTRKEMGLRGFELVKHQFNWNKIAQDMLSVYHWVLGKGEKPACVYE